MNYNFNKKLLKRVMKEKKISREQLATLLTDAGLDISLNGVNYWFRDENNKPEIEKAKAISEILDIPFDKLVSQDIFITQKSVDNNIDTSEMRCIMDKKFNYMFLKRLLIANDLTYEGLLALLKIEGCNLTINAIKSWFRNDDNLRAVPNIDKIVCLANIFNCSTDDFFNDVPITKKHIISKKGNSPTSEISEIQSNNIATKQDYLLHKKQPDTIYVPFFKDGLASAGKGIINFDTGDYDYIPFKESDLKLMFNVNPKSKLGIIPCAGNSMEPTIKEGDLIVFQQDFSQIEGAIYVCRYDDELFVKRLRKRPKIALISDNKDYEPIEISESENIDILGRVVGCYSIKSKQI